MKMPELETRPHFRPSLRTRKSTPSSGLQLKRLRPTLKRRLRSTSCSSDFHSSSWRAFSEADAGLFLREPDDEEEEAPLRKGLPGGNGNI